MFSKVVSAVLFTALAGRALAQGTPTTNFTVAIGPHATIIKEATQVLNFSIASFPVIASCAPGCATAQAAINSCASTTPNLTACYCAADLANSLGACETCMFNALVIANKPAPTALAGSNQVLAGWTANCANSTTPLATPLALSVADLPWDGPFVSVFPTAIGWVIAVTGGVLGSSLIYMLCQM
ncbi:hypothetical protein K438DRAFT_1825378 [Mycena galopus ATCC 62051]|nr:hypothetical protein K438DRAFT_1825378 [Mycena galopus ATCC 62051]